MKPKAQISSFLVILILVFVGVLFALFFSSHGPQQEDFLGRDLDVAALNEYVSGCFIKATKDALLQLGRQGGYLYHYQAPGLPFAYGPPFFPYGIYILPVNISGSYANVSFGILSVRASFPDYPSLNTSVYDLPETFLFGWPKRAQGNFLSLCDIQGTNPLLSPVLPRFCETYSNTGSIEKYMRLYLKTKTLECMNTSLFFGYNVTIDEAKVGVRFTEDKVQFAMDVPLTLSSLFSDYNTSSLHYVVSYPVRLKKIHELATHLVNHEMQSLFFDPVFNASFLQDCKTPLPYRQPTACLKSEMKVSYLLNPCLHDPYYTCSDPYADVINITDNASLINGKPFSFYFAIHNRPPVLDYLHETGGMFLGNVYDYVIVAGDTLTIDPYGYDPDLDLGYQGCKDNKGRLCLNKTYYYLGWKATYEQQNIVDANNQLVGIVYTDDQGNQKTISGISCPYPYTTCADQWDFWENGKLSVNAWNNSVDFQQTGRKATILTTDADVGPHVVRVMVCDEGGLCDWQDVKILVLGITSVGFNPYGGEIDPKYASVEDNYTLLYRGDKTNVDSVVWEYQDDSGDALIGLADDPDYEAHLTINDIKDPAHTLSSLQFVPNKSVNRLLTTITYTDLTTFSFQNEIPLYACLPAYKVDTDFDGLPDAAPYPYQSFAGDNYPADTDDPFKGSHICCKGNDDGTEQSDPDESDDTDWGVYEDTSKICYNLSYYTCSPVIYLLSHSNDIGNRQSLFDNFGSLFFPHIDPFAYDPFNIYSIPYSVLSMYVTDLPIPPLNYSLTITSTKTNGMGIATRRDLADFTLAYQPGPLNALYNRSFKQRCSGDRGNICAGDISDDTWKVAKRCLNDDNPSDIYEPDPDESASCMVPNVFLNGAELKEACKNGGLLTTDLSTVDCSPYYDFISGKPFETLLGLNINDPTDNSDDAYCNIKYRCAKVTQTLVYTPTREIKREYTVVDTSDLKNNFVPPFNGRCKKLKCNGDGTCTNVDDVECEYCSLSDIYRSYGAPSSYDHLLLNGGSCKPIPYGNDICDGSSSNFFDLDIDKTYCYNPAASSGNAPAMAFHHDMETYFYSRNQQATDNVWLPSGEFVPFGEYFNDPHQPSSPPASFENDQEDHVLFAFGTPLQGYHVASSPYLAFDCCGDDPDEYSVLLDDYTPSLGYEKSCRKKLLNQPSYIPENFAFCCNDANDKIHDFYTDNFALTSADPNPRNMFCVAECWYFNSLIGITESSNQLTFMFQDILTENPTPSPSSYQVSLGLDSLNTCDGNHAVVQVALNNIDLPNHEFTTKPISLPYPYLCSFNFTTTSNEVLFIMNLSSAPRYLS